MKTLVRRFLSTMLILMSAASLQAAGADAEPVRVAEVRVTGNRAISYEAVLAHVLTRPGHGYSHRLLLEDCQRLLRSSKFSAAVVTTDKTDKGMVVTFVVAERPLVSSIELRGNRLFSDQVLAAKLTFAAGDPLDAFAVEAGRKALLDEYRKDYHYFAEIHVHQSDLTKLNKVVYVIVEGPRVRIRKVKIEGNKHFGSWNLKSDIESSSNPWWWIFGGGQVDMDMIKRDVVAIRRKYLDAGFLDVEVGRLLEFSDDKEDAILTFHVKENTRYLVNRVQVKGNSIFSEKELLRKFTVSRGNYAEAEAIQTTGRAIEMAYGRLGYIDTHVQMRKQYLSPTDPLPDWAQQLQRTGRDVAVIDLLFTVDEGGQVRIGRIDLRPAAAYKYAPTITESRILRRQLTVFPRHIFNTAAADRSENKLQDSRIFKNASITPIGAGQNVRDVIVEAAEGQTGNFILGLSLSSDSGLGAHITYREQNYDPEAWPGSWREIIQGRAWKGAGQQLTVSAEPGTERSLARVNWGNPSIYDLPYSVGVGAHTSSSYRDTHDENSQGLTLSVGRRFKNSWYTELYSRTENVEFRNLEDDSPADVRLLRGTTFIQGFGISLTRDRTDSRWLPSVGDRFQIGFEQVVGDFTFPKVTSNYRVYQTLHVDALDRKHVLGLKVGGGRIFDQAPVFERYYGGGQNSIRGFKFRGISPRSGAGNDPIGGNFMLMAGAEYGFPLAGETLRGVIFLDSGAAERTMTISKYRVSTGFGLQWNVEAMGSVPVRLDFGFPLAKDKEDDTRLISFSIGWSF